MYMTLISGSLYLQTNYGPDQTAPKREQSDQVSYCLLP